MTKKPFSRRTSTPAQHTSSHEKRADIDLTKSLRDAMGPGLQVGVAVERIVKGNDRH